MEDLFHKIRGRHFSQSKLSHTAELLIINIYVSGSPICYMLADDTAVYEAHLTNTGKQTVRCLMN